MEVYSPGSHIGSTLSEALGLSNPGAQRVAQDQLQQASGRGAVWPGGTGQALVEAPRIAAAERAGEAGEIHPRGRFVNFRV